ncbi:MAG: 50S ribosomal protein L21 [Candidatus Levybacteria bacterium RIFCSPHIGHO2_01_FULL_37_17]|nr:MAG: 50S ribosomal protein L21 [Candidatus Levybacteria bacterium RIFCSPHIGHO2_01_FULL_37_17]OGH36685.1 MAG: 50S ribosomal protein L21 [Candidatus Levybacteria bacterium RIFCSPLOWO2_01_FULL_38_23]
MKYAVIKTGGKQYKVKEGDVIEVDRLSEKGQKIVFDEVLLSVTDSTVKIGKPKIANGKVEAQLINNTRGEKIRVSKFKAKVRYRKTTGFRANLTKVKITKII